MTTLDIPQRNEDAEAPAPAAESGVRMSTLFTFAFAMAGMALGLRQLHDNSFMWHVRTGQWILDHGIPHGDPYSYTAPGVKWVAQSWLAELSYGIINNLGGAFGLRLFGGVVGGIFGALLFVLALRVNGDRVRAFGLALLALAVTWQVWSERPLMLGLLGMLVVVFIIEVPNSWISRRPEISLPIVMWLWTNVHGTFSLGFLYLALHLGGRLLEGVAITRGRERKILIGTAIASVAAFVNPYGIDLVLFPIHLMGRGRILAGIEEWQSPHFRELGGLLFGAFLLTTVALLARKGCGKRDLLVTLVFLFLGLYAVRNVGTTAVVVLPILARAWRPAGEGSARPDLRTPLNRLVAVLIIVAGLAFVVRASGQPDWDVRAYPRDAMRAVAAKGWLGRHLLTTDAWGGYVILTRYPQQKVFFDDRYDTYPLAVNDDYDKILGVQPGWDAVLDRYGIDVIVWPKTGAVVQALALKPEWTRVYSDKLAVVYVRRTLAGS